MRAKQVVAYFKTETKTYATVHGNRSPLCNGMYATSLPLLPTSRKRCPYSARSNLAVHTSCCAPTGLMPTLPAVCCSHTATVVSNTVRPTEVFDHIRVDTQRPQPWSDKPTSHSGLEQTTRRNDEPIRPIRIGPNLAICPKEWSTQHSARSARSPPVYSRSCGEDNERSNFDSNGEGASAGTGNA